MRQQRYLWIIGAIVIISALDRGPIAQSNGDPALPSITLDTDDFPAMTGTSRPVYSSADFNNALAAAVPGDEIVIDETVTISGPVTLPPQNGTGWIVIRSASMAALPSQRHRIDPTTHAAHMPKFVSYSGTTSALTAAVGFGTFAQYYRLVGIEMTYDDTVTDGSANLVDLGRANPLAPGAETNPNNLPQFIYFDRCYIHAKNGQPAKRGIAANARSIAVVDSYVSNFKYRGQDSQAFAEWNGPGPLKLDNDYLEGSTENVIFGGSDPSIPGLVASDITVTRNTMQKPPAWLTTPSPNGAWLVKNILELKNVQRVLVDGNDFQYNWSDGQDGYAIVFTPRNQTGGNNNTVVQDVTFTNNYVRHSGAGVNILGFDNNFPSLGTTRIKIQNNLFDDINPSWWDGRTSNPPGHNGKVFLITAASVGGVKAPSYVKIDHNTFVAAIGDNDLSTAIALSGSTDIPYFTFTNNVIRHGQYGVIGDALAPDCTGTPSTFGVYFQTGLTFTNNVIVGAPSGGTSNWSANYDTRCPQGVATNYFPGSWADVQFVRFTDPPAIAPEATGGRDYHLAGGADGGGSGSLYRIAATGGSSAIGVDVDQLDARQSVSMLFSGDWDGDGQIDPAVQRTFDGPPGIILERWSVSKSSTAYATRFDLSSGNPTDPYRDRPVRVAADYDGDRKTDPVVFRRQTNQWIISQSSSNYTTSMTITWGTPTDVPVPGDYDGDGKADLAVFRPSTGQWWILYSSTGYTSSSVVAWGVGTDVPVPGDYDGDGKADPAVFRPSTGTWYMLKSSTNYQSSSTVGWGLPTDVPVPGDYDGDGKTDPAVYRPFQSGVDTGQWFILLSSTNYTTNIVQNWGVKTDTPVVGDFDGDRKADLAVYRSACVRPTQNDPALACNTGYWYVKRSSDNYASSIVVFSGF